MTISLEFDEKANPAQHDGFVQGPIQSDTQDWRPGLFSDRPYGTHGRDLYLADPVAQRRDLYLADPSLRGVICISEFPSLVVEAMSFLPREKLGVAVSPDIVRRDGLAAPFPPAFFWCLLSCGLHQEGHAGTLHGLCGLWA
jgi:hypothetical protein